ncbi:hypothetical protein J6590_101968, partial [Homalodisca vitripennis]
LYKQIERAEGYEVLFEVSEPEPMIPLRIIDQLYQLTIVVIKPMSHLMQAIYMACGVMVPHSPGK